MERGLFNRTERLVGKDVMHTIKNKRVIIFGVGGVGSWCAECLVRSGISHLTIVDSDCVCVTNINRQLMATTKTIGQAKVDVLKARLLDINPQAEIVALQQIYSDEAASEFCLDRYDYIIDAIDSLKDKASLILRACQTQAVFFSSMGAALKMDPTQIKVAEFWKVRGCPLGAAIRKKFKHMKVRPAHKFKCVYSEQVLENRGDDFDCSACVCDCPKAKGGQTDGSLASHDWNATKAQINGSMAHITAIFGFTIGGLVLDDIYTKAHGSEE